MTVTKQTISSAILWQLSLRATQRAPVLLLLCYLCTAVM